MDNPLNTQRKSHHLFGSFRKRHSILSTIPSPSIPSSETLNNSDSSEISSLNSLTSANSSTGNIPSENHRPASVSSASTADSAKSRKKHHHRNFGTFSRHISMTPFDKAPPKVTVSSSTGNGSGLKKTPSQLSLFSASPEGTKKNQKSLADSVKEAHRRDMERWILMTKLNSTAVPEDCLTYSSTRLSLLLELYDTALRGEDTEGASFAAKFDLLEFWAISALKFISGVNVHVTGGVLTAFQNYVKKDKEKMKILRFHDQNYGIQWGWQLAVDNPSALVFNYATTPILYTVNTYDNKKIGPSNFHVVHGRSFFELPFSKDSFSFTLAYSLFYSIREDEWVPVLRELHRITQPNGTVNLFLMDLDSVNCTNEVFNDFFKKMRKIFDSKGIDTNPCRKTQARLREAGFQNVKYSLISLKKGVPNQMGNMMEFLMTYFEFILYTRVATKEMDNEDLHLFRDLKIDYNEGLRNGKFMDEFGDLYFMFVFGEKLAD